MMPTSPVPADSRLVASREYSDPRPASKRRVLLVEDHPVTRCGLRQLLNQQLNLEVCGEADSAEMAAEMTRDLRPDVAIVDISLPVANGLECTKTIRCCAPKTAVLVLSMHSETLYAEESMRAGAQGYLNKAEAPEKLLTAVDRVLRGETYFSAQVRQRMVQAMAHRRRRGPGFTVDTLSARELEVLRLIGDGYTPVEIAQQLELSRKTIDTYREHLRHKLAIDDGAGLVRYAIQWRCVTDPVAEGAIA